MHLAALIVAVVQSDQCNGRSKAILVTARSFLPTLQLPSVQHWSSLHWGTLAQKFGQKDTFSETLMDK